MRLQVVTILLAGPLLVAGPAPSAGGDKKSGGELDGTWQMVSITGKGKDIPPDDIKNMTVEIKDGRAVVRRGGQVVGASDLKIDPSKTPKTIDSTTTSPGQGKEQLSKGIYELKGDTLRLCTAVSGKERPTSFASTAENLQSILILRRQKK
jgi:uncharacterized protein (TIGR03067 family)